MATERHTQLDTRETEGIADEAVQRRNTELKIMNTHPQCLISEAEQSRDEAYKKKGVEYSVLTVYEGLMTYCFHHRGTHTQLIRP